MTEQTPQADAKTEAPKPCELRQVQTGESQADMQAKYAEQIARMSCPGCGESVQIY